MEESKIKIKCTTTLTLPLEARVTFCSMGALKQEMWENETP